MTIRNEAVYGCDIDGTLISLRRFEVGTPGTIAIMNRYVNEFRHVKVHKAHVELIEEMMGRGRFIVFWSGSGVLWVDEVLKQLGIRLIEGHYLTMTKPVGCVDDVAADKWLGNRIFIPAPEIETHPEKTE
jgi:hypothetical protein